MFRLNVTSCCLDLFESFFSILAAVFSAPFTFLSFLPFLPMAAEMCWQGDVEVQSLIWQFKWITWGTQKKISCGTPPKETSTSGNELEVTQYRKVLAPPSVSEVIQTIVLRPLIVETRNIDHSPFTILAKLRNCYENIDHGIHVNLCQLNTTILPKHLHTPTTGQRTGKHTTNAQELRNVTKRCKCQRGLKFPRAIFDWKPMLKYVCHSDKPYAFPRTLVSFARLNIRVH